MSSKIKLLIFALLAVTGISTAWATNLPTGNPLSGNANNGDGNPAKSTYNVQWTGETTVIYNALPQNGLSASYVDEVNVEHTLTLTFTNGTEVITTPSYPVKAGTWTVEAQPLSPTDVLNGATTTLVIQPAKVSVVGASAQVAKFHDGTNNAIVTNIGTLEGVQGSDAVTHNTTAAFNSPIVGTNKTITFTYTLIGAADVLANYVLIPQSEILVTNGAIIESITTGADAASAIDVNAYGYCTGNSYSIRYNLNSGNPNQYKIDFTDSRFTDVNWTNLTTPGANGTIDINVPANLPTGDYEMKVYFRDNNFSYLVSDPITVNIHVNLPQTYTMPLFNDVIALVDTCNCFTEIQWYHRANPTDTWTAIDGANGYYYREVGGLTGEYFVRAKMNGVETYTCPQTDVETLITDEDQPLTVNAWPNPATSNITVSIEGSNTFTHTLRVLNTVGVEMECRTFEGKSTTINMNDYQHGNYVVNVDGVVVRIIKN